MLIKLNVGGYLAKNNDVTENTPITQDNTEDMETRTLELGGLAGTFGTADHKNLGLSLIHISEPTRLDDI